MSDDDFGFAVPPFKPDEALLRAKRDLRELGLTEREGRFERRSQQIAKVAVEGATLNEVWPRQRPLPEQWWWKVEPNKTAPPVQNGNGGAR